MAQPRKLRKSSRDKVLTGVCGGVAEYLGIDSTVVRLLFALFAILSLVSFLGFGCVVLAYIVAALIMPSSPPAANTIVTPSPDTSPGATVAPAPGTGDSGQARNTLGIALVIIGGIILVVNIGFFSWFRLQIFVPLALIGLGLWLVLGRMGARRA